jgi:hypothetical protein
MSYNFKSIVDVEVVAEPAESANVLIEENGVIKKAPKTAVGGGDWDAVIEVNWYDDEDPKFMSGNYQSIYNKIMVEQEVPKIKIISKTDWYGANYSVSSSNYAVYHESGDYITITFRSQAENNYLTYLFINPDNTFSD